LLTLKEIKDILLEDRKKITITQERLLKKRKKLLRK